MAYHVREEEIAYIGIDGSAGSSELSNVFWSEGGFRMKTVGSGRGHAEESPAASAVAHPERAK
jgi:hypothetical protein